MSKQTPEPLETHYDAHSAAKRYYPLWQAQGVNRGDPAKPGPAFSVIMPPPNVTGALHMGHALNNTLQDVLVRYKRMDGFNVVWIPGLDHASIAVHWVIERDLLKEGTTRMQLGRDAFLQRAQAFKEASQARIVSQQKELGISCDWDRLAFTLDSPRQTAVTEAFVRLYEDGLIYRAERLVNWDPVSRTALSDLEVEHQDNVKAELYRFAYVLCDGDGELVVATTRPETVFGDTAVAVHPDDARYQHLIGKTVRHPLMDRALPIVGDAILVDPAFGTGAVKITPAHDFNDFEVGQRHGLPSLNVLNKDGTLAAVCGAFAGMSVVQARQAVKDKLDALGLGRGAEPHRLSIGRSERSGAIVEPMLSEQWFVRTKPLARPSIAAIEHGKTQFVPKAWENTYFAWLRNIRDWCISRQLWWGHRIPAWFCGDCQHVTVARTTPAACEACQSPQLTQETDVLDTWFSSALWPFSTQGWPQPSEALARWYPTATLVTSFDIIFPWVARMMMFGQYFMGEVPFKDVVLHALIRDKDGDKMSKTKGNVVDPLQMIERFGCDAFRFTLVSFAGHGRDVRWDEARAVGHQKFCNKIWQAYRFTIGHVPQALVPAKPAAASFSVWDRWIMQALAETTRKMRDALDSYRFNDAAAAIYSFVWDTFCDWYLEIAKTALYDEAAGAEVAARQGAVRYTLLEVFAAVARLLHPIMPFLSEDIWQKLPQTKGYIVAQSYPKPTDWADDAQARDEAGFITQVIVAIRRTRSEFGVAPKDRIAVQVDASGKQQGWLTTHAPVILSLARAEVTLTQEAPPKQAATERVQGARVTVPLSGLIDFAAESARLQKEQGKVEKELARIVAQLERADFMAKAPPEIVDEKNRQRSDAQLRLSTIATALSRLA